MMRRLLILFTLLFISGEASAQTLFSTRGLGLPVQPVDARATALGGIGVGLPGFNLSLGNPAEVAGLVRRGATATLQPSWNSIALGGQEEDIGGSRFPLIRIIYPVNSRLVANLAYGGYLDQAWGVEFTGEEVLGQDTIGTSDVIRSTGGVGQLQFGFAYTLSEKLAVGLNAGLFTGSLNRSVRRTFEDTVAFQSFESLMSWSYRAPQATIGLRWDPRDGVRVAGAATISGDLKANAEEGAAEDRTYGAPLKLTAGASARVAPMLMANVGVTKESFPDVTSPGTGAAGSAGASTSDTWQYGGGLEYTGIRSGARVFPLRLGARSAQLPYAGALESSPSEWAVSFGTGFALSTSQGLPEALADFTVERGSRSGFESDALPDGLSENFWRVSLSLSLFSR